MGKLGLYQCFTVPRDDKTLTNYFTTKRDDEICDFFYDLPTMADDMTKKSNQHKLKFLKSKRFVDNIKPHSSSNSPKSSAQLSKNSPAVNVTEKENMKQNSSTKSQSPQKQEQQPFFYYPSTSVPEMDLCFQRDRKSTPAPGRYNPHDVTCKCYLSNAEDDIKCPGDVEGDGHQHVFKSNVFRLVRPLPPQLMRRHRRWSKLENAANTFFLPNDDSLMEAPRTRPPREPISFRIKKSKSSDDLHGMIKEREFRFNTVIKRKHLVSVKTGRPVGFLTATPRFFELESTTTRKNEVEKKRNSSHEDDDEKPRRKPISRKRLELLATPKNLQSKLCSTLSVAVAGANSKNGSFIDLGTSAESTTTIE